MKKYILFLVIIFLNFFVRVNAQSVFKFDNDLSVGSTGKDVAELQSWLINNKFDILAISNGQATKGFFGSQTRNALAKYQESIGIPNTGYFGPLTRAKINNIDISSSAFNIISPRGNENWQMGSSQTIRWNAPSFIRATYVDINLIPYSNTSEIKCPSGYECTSPKLLTNGTITSPLQSEIVTSIVKNININLHSYNWTVSNRILVGKYIMQICQTGTSVCAESKLPFTISKSTTTLSTITVLSPNGDESWTIGTPRTISWKLADSIGANTKVDLYLLDSSRCLMGMNENVDSNTTIPPYNCNNLITLDNSIQSNTAYNWIVGTDKVNNQIRSGQYKIKICIAESTTCDESDNLFTLMK